MNENYVDISVVQDRSGSMGDVRDETIAGFNTFLKDQKQLPGKCLFTLMQFNTEFKLLYTGEDIQKVQPLTHDTYQPDGYTALLDAIGRTILTTGQRLEAMPEAERPAKVVIAISTDGKENKSQEFQGEQGRQRVFAMIKEQTEVYKWNFIFLGANQDAIEAGEGMGIGAKSAMSVANNTAGIQAAYCALTSNVTSYRMCSDLDAAPDKLAFTEAQRKEQLDAGAAKDKLTGKA